MVNELRECRGKEGRQGERSRRRERAKCGEETIYMLLQTHLVRFTVGFPWRSHTLSMHFPLYRLSGEFLFSVWIPYMYSA